MMLRPFHELTAAEVKAAFEARKREGETFDAFMEWGANGGFGGATAGHCDLSVEELLELWQDERAEGKD